MPVFGQFSQTVTVSGLPALVHDCSIKESSSERVVSIDFALELLDIPGQAVAFHAALIGEPVTVTQTVDGDSQTWSVIITNVTESRTGAFTYKRVQCRSLEYLASHTRFLDRWSRTAASDVVIQAFQRHAAGSPTLRNLSLAGVDTNATLIAEYASKFDSLYDVMEEVCLMTQWAWKIRGNTLFFFDPLENPGPDITQGARGIVRDTLQLKQSLEGVYNVYRGQAWAYKTLSLSNYFQSGDCIDGFQFNPGLLRGVEVVGEPRIVQRKWRDLGLEVSSVDEAGIVELNKSISANIAINGQMTVQLEVRGIHWVERFDQKSIEVYGRRDASPLSDSGGDTIRAMSNKLDELLKYRAYPAYDVQLEVVGVGWEPDQIVNVSLIDPNFTAPLYVTDVTRTTDGSDLSVSITLTSPTEIIQGEGVPLNIPRRSLSGVDPAYEIGRRVERLERRDAHPASILGVNTSVDGILRGVEEQSQNQGWSTATGSRRIGEEVRDARGWGQTVSSLIPLPLLWATGWFAATQAVLKPPVLNGAAGWAGAFQTSLAELAEPLSASGWSQSVTVRGTSEEIGAARGWSQSVTFKGASEEIGAARGWASSTLVKVFAAGVGLSVDDEVGLYKAAQGISISDDVYMG